MVICQVCGISVFSIPRKTRGCARNPIRRANIADFVTPEHLPIDVIISPEREGAGRAERLTREPHTFETKNSMDGHRPNYWGSGSTAELPTVLCPRPYVS